MEFTKENFWNELYTAFPEGTQIFCDWMDRYKANNNWNELFNSDSNWQDANGKNALAPKFHNLPYAMQLGIWIEFVIENTPEWEIENMSKYDLREDISEYVKHVLQATATTKL
jgi:hypothetical protein